MTQDAVVTKLLPNHMAEVAVARSTACGSNCGNCESCIFQNELKVAAKNRIDAKPGQKVVIASKSSTVFGAMLLVYIMPMVLFLLGYAIAYLLDAKEGICVAVSFAALILGAAIMVYTQRVRKNKNPITFEIIR